MAWTKFATAELFRRIYTAVNFLFFFHAPTHLASTLLFFFAVFAFFFFLSPAQITHKCWTFINIYITCERGYSCDPSSSPQICHLSLFQFSNSQLLHQTFTSIFFPLNNLTGKVLKSWSFLIINVIKLSFCCHINSFFFLFWNCKNNRPLLRVYRFTNKTLFLACNFVLPFTTCVGIKELVCQLIF